MIDWQCRKLVSAIHAVDISPTAVAQSRNRVGDLLVAKGCPSDTASALAASWVRNEDFLLSHDTTPCEWVVGNPPYVRLEDLPKPVLQAYRKHFVTLTERADLYIAFIERGLSLLSEPGVLAFICANRFTKNRYGQSLRAMIAKHFRVRAYIDLEHTQPFATEVSAYPAIVVLDRKQGKGTLAGGFRRLSAPVLEAVRTQLVAKDSRPGPLTRFESWYQGAQAWRTTSREILDLLAHLESNHPKLVESAPGTRVGIGVATGADEVFVVSAQGVPGAIETAQLLPLALAKDVRLSTLDWSGHFLVNPYDAESGALVDLDRFPGLKSYLLLHRQRLSDRFVARAHPGSWYKTIDRVSAGLTHTPKILIPDIQAGGVAAFDPGEYYPHHNLYWVTSSAWNLRALQTILRSSIVRCQLATLSVQMRGGSLRYQAQSLRQVHVPPYDTLSSSLIERLCDLSAAEEQEAIDEASIAAFNLSSRHVCSVIQTIKSLMASPDLE